MRLGYCSKAELRDPSSPGLLESSYLKTKVVSENSISSEDGQLAIDTVTSLVSAPRPWKEILPKLGAPEVLVEYRSIRPETCDDFLIENCRELLARDLVSFVQELASVLSGLEEDLCVLDENSEDPSTEKLSFFTEDLVHDVAWNLRALTFVVETVDDLRALASLHDFLIPHLANYRSAAEYVGEVSNKLRTARNEKER